MPLLLYNGQILPEEDLRLPLSNRAFQYNDGFFETLVLEKGMLRFWPEHRERMEEAGSVLRLELPPELLTDCFPQIVKELAEKNHCGSITRVKFKVWRAGEGLYTPQTNQTDWLVTVQSAQTPIEEPLHVGICQTVRTIPSVFSSFKGINSPVYVLASQEKTARGLDDLILLDPAGNLAELTYSNLFWVKDQSLFTPALETGCLHGVMRRKLLQWARQKNWQVQEGFFTRTDFTGASVVFAGNVTGLRMIETVEGERTGAQSSLLHQIWQELKI
ncbi:aminotransferase class IV [Rufibacter sp. XAAS-G3-1]|uniref:aminotransferase class IV n=1 Tax=Rufibacter sp. XAAS-G3-1 TaxID=2729134 RepID=UPI0015E68BD2|nr:aminotransferase class IV [Rufibacter sp. XAAS-G3-1]